MGDEQWQVAGSAAQVYERQLVPAIFAPWAPRVLDLPAPAVGERVLDAACGTGVVARLAAERVDGGGDHAGAVRVGDEEALRGLVAGAGFWEVELDRQVGVVWFGSARELVVAYGAGPCGSTALLQPPGATWAPLPCAHVWVR